MKFIRYGNLVPQEHDGVIRNMHSAPVQYGIYAFPNGYKEPYLLGGIGYGNIQNGRWRFVRDENKKKIKAKLSDFFADECGDEIREPYKSLLKKQNIKKAVPYILNDDGVVSFCYDYDEIKDKEFFYVTENKPRIFEYNGNLWHHLYNDYNDKIILRPNEIIKRTEYWVLTDIKTYERVLNEYVLRMKYYYKNKYAQKSSLYASGIPINCFSKDEFEVFIEKVE